MFPSGSSAPRLSRSSSAWLKMPKGNVASAASPPPAPTTIPVPASARARSSIVVFPSPASPTRNKAPPRPARASAKVASIAAVAASRSQTPCATHPPLGNATRGHEPAGNRQFWAFAGEEGGYKTGEAVEHFRSQKRCCNPRPTVKPERSENVSTDTPTSATDASASNSALTLVPPQPVGTITDHEAASMVRVDPVTATRIDGMVDSYIRSLTSLEPTSVGFASKVDAIHTMGNDEIRQSASVSNRLLDKPVKAMESGPFSKGATVSKSLVDLRRTVEDLDPSQQGLLSPKHLFGLIPFGNRLRDYFGRYQSAQGHLNAIIQALYRGQDELRQDDAAIEQEKVNVWSIKGRLEQYVYLANKLDAALEAQIDQVALTD